MGVNIYNDFKTYTEISKNCFKYLLKKAIAIYKEKNKAKENNKQLENEDQLKFDL